MPQLQLMFPVAHRRRRVDLGIRHRIVYALDRIALLCLASLLAAFGLRLAGREIMQGDRAAS